VLIPVAWCAALLAQAQIVFELAALAGYSASDEMRAADLLVLQGAYGSSAEARAALARVTTASAPSRRLRVDMIWRMAYMLGLLGPGGAQRGLIRRILGWVFVCVVFPVGFVLPFVWLRTWPSGCVRARLSSASGRRRFMRPEPAPARGSPRRSVQAGLAGGFVRMALLLGVSIALFVVAILSGGWVGTGVLLFVAMSFGLTSAWIGYRWWRRRRARALRRLAAPGRGPF
jgi:hypothetical protein